jgi:lipoate-protein ligase A
MQYIELTLPDPESNLACDEAFLKLFEARRATDALLRIWEPKNHFVVLGHSNRIDAEVNFAGCESERVPILRRLSGGGTVMQGPGCLNYSLILRNGVDIPLDIGGAFQFVLEHHKQCIQEMIGDRVDIAGVSDLVIKGRKFSGNAQYRKRRFTLLHGTFLLNLDSAIVGRCLRLPSKQPAYRQNRSHSCFMRNLHLDPVDVRQALRTAWFASDQFTDVPYGIIAELKNKRYGQPDWTLKF